MARIKREEASVVVQLREAIEASGRTLVDIGRASGVHPAQLSRFMTGKRDITFAAAGRIMEALGLKLVREGPAAEPKKRPRKRG
jgi:plasmid maintenance system antidote protein VapI